jgi:hypothetical protein
VRHGKTDDGGGRRHVTVPVCRRPMSVDVRSGTVGTEGGDARSSDSMNLKVSKNEAKEAQRKLLNGPSPGWKGRC